jgi:hypothetical protein
MTPLRRPPRSGSTTCAQTHFTLKTNPLKREDLEEFVTLYNPADRHERKTTWGEELDSGSEAGMALEGGLPGQQRFCARPGSDLTTAST